MTTPSLTEILNEIPVSLSPQAEVVAQKRYFLKNNKNDVIEDASQMFRRVANAVASVEKQYGKLDVDVQLTANDFYTVMSSNASISIILFLLLSFLLLVINF